MHKITLSIVCLVALVGSGACSISNSAGKLSDSVSSPFEWSSSSSDSSSGDDSAYRQDVSDYTVAFARDAGDLDSFRIGLRGLAERRGITNWEEDELTLASIGLGLQRARLDEAAELAFGRELLGDANARGLEALHAGYASIQ